MRQLLEELSVPELEAWAAAQPLAPAVATALGIPPQSAPATPKAPLWLRVGLMAAAGQWVLRVA